MLHLLRRRHAEHTSASIEVKLLLPKLSTSMTGLTAPAAREIEPVKWLSFSMSADSDVQLLIPGASVPLSLLWLRESCIIPLK
jgi:hypothetical protein